MDRAAPCFAALLVFFLVFYLYAREASAQQPPSQGDADIVASISSETADRAENCVNKEIDSLSAESDFTVFMHQDCAPEVRLEALRRLWRLLPRPTIAFDAAM